MRPAAAKPLQLVLQDSIPRAMSRLAWPLFLRFQLAVLLSLVPTFWLGRFFGREGLSVAAAAAPLEQVLLNLLYIVTIGSAALLAKAVGARNEQLAARLVVGSLRGVMFLGALIAAVALVFIDPLTIKLAGALPIAAPLRGYVVPLLLGLPFVGVTYALLGTFAAAGWAFFGAVRQLVDLVFAFALTRILLALGLGFSGPPLSLLGAALFLNVITWVPLKRRAPEMGIGELKGAGPVFDWQIWRKMVALGAPVQLGRIAQFFANLLLVRIVSEDGVLACAGFGIAYRLVYFGSSTMWSFARASSIMIGQAMGARNVERTRATLRIAAMVMAALCAALMLVTLAARPVVGLLASDPPVVDVATRVLRLLAWSFPALAVSQLLADAYLAMGNAKIAGLVMCASTLAGLETAVLLDGPALMRASYGFCAQAIVQAILLALLLRHAFLKPLAESR